MPAAVIQPEKLLRQLSDLWAAYGKEEADATGVLRACSMTLIALADAAEDPAALDETLALLMRDHPSRVIVARSTNGAGAPSAASATSRRTELVPMSMAATRTARAEVSRILSE